MTDDMTELGFIEDIKAFGRDVNGLADGLAKYYNVPQQNGHGDQLG